MLIQSDFLGSEKGGSIGKEYLRSPQAATWQPAEEYASKSATRGQARASTKGGTMAPSGCTVRTVPLLKASRRPSDLLASQHGRERAIRCKRLRQHIPMAVHPGRPRSDFCGCNLAEKRIGVDRLARADLLPISWKVTWVQQEGA